MPDARKPARPLWDRFWVRLPAYLIGAPFVIGLTDLATIIVIIWTTAGSFAGLAGPQWWGQLVIVIGVQMALLLIPLIAAELGNRRRGRAVPPDLCALFVATFSVAGLVTIYGLAQLASRIEQIFWRYDWIVGMGAICGSALLAYAISWALVSPLIRRWVIRNASARDLAEHF